MNSKTRSNLSQASIASNMTSESSGKATPISNIGTVSLLMTFIVLCLVAFSVLSLSGATADYHYGQRISQAQKDYFEAEARAYEKLEAIEDALAGIAVADSGAAVANSGAAVADSGVAVADSGAEVADSGPVAVDSVIVNNQSYYNACVQALRSISDVDCIFTEDGQLLLAYGEPIGEKYILRVVLSVCEQTDAANYVKITEWKKVAAEAWEGDEHMHLYIPQTEE